MIIFLIIIKKINKTLSQLNYKHNQVNKLLFFAYLNCLSN